MNATLAAELELSAEARRRLREPLRRGKFMPLDAARRRLALASADDERGQARVYWLVDLQDGRVADARFLAFGGLASHPVADAFCEAAIGRPLPEACAISAAEIEAMLRDEAGTPAFAGHGLEPLGFLAAIQERLLAQRDDLEVLPEPKEVPRYERKREQDWDDQDREWLPLSLMQKIVRVQEELKAVEHDRLGDREVAWELEGLHDDFAVRIRFADAPREQVPTLLKLLEEPLRERVHPEIRLEDADDE